MPPAALPDPGGTNPQMIPSVLARSGVFSQLGGPFSGLVGRGDAFGDDAFEVVFAGDLEHGRFVDVEPVGWEFDARVFEAEVGERFAAFEVGKVGCRCSVDVEDAEDVVGGQGVVAKLGGGFEYVHPALQSGEGRDTVGSECDDLAVDLNLNRVSSSLLVR